MIPSAGAAVSLAEPFSSQRRDIVPHLTTLSQTVYGRTVGVQN